MKKDFNAKQEGLTERSLLETLDKKTDWKPSSSVLDKEKEEKPKVRITLRGIFNTLSWLLIVLSGVAFVVLMWLPSKPVWLVVTVVTVVAVFAVGVLSLFLTTGGRNTNVDSHGAAI